MIDTSAVAIELRDRVGDVPRVAVVLGSGLGHLVEALTDAEVIPFEEIGLPVVGVKGHGGAYHLGRLGETPVLLQAGRFHAYEGHPMETVVAPVRMLGGAGVETLVLTNAAGGIRNGLEPGSLLLLDDHINLMFRNPLAGPVVGDEQRFPDMSAPYDGELQRHAMEAAAEVGVRLERGTYAAVLGPSFETPAEIRMLAKLGADVVGMSTVPEVIAARAAGIRCVAVSMVTNKAAGLGLEPLSHEEVLETGREAGTRLGRVIEGLVARASAPAQSVGAK